MKTLQTKQKVTQKQFEIDWKLLDVFLSYADESYADFVKEFKKEENEWRRAGRGD